MIRIVASGDFSKTKGFLSNIRNFNKEAKLNKYGEMGVKALEAATPKDTGKTAASWEYSIKMTDTQATITWENTNCTEGKNKGIPIVVLIKYGHGNGKGGQVPPNDFITPAMKPIFDKIANDAWGEVKNS